MKRTETQTQSAFGFAALYGQEKCRPISHGDRLMTKPFGRVVVTHVGENLEGFVYVCIRLDTGNECVVLEREVEYRYS